MHSADNYSQKKPQKITKISQFREHPEYYVNFDNESPLLHKTTFSFVLH